MTANVHESGCQSCRRMCRGVVVASCLLAPQRGHAQPWTSVVLHRPEFRESRLYCAGGGRVGGNITFNLTSSAPTVWEPPSTVGHSLVTPPGIYPGVVHGLWDSSAVGY